MDRLKNSKETAKFRDLLLKTQNNIDPITQTRITDPVLDHDHNTGHCRAVLQREVNSFEGKIINAYNRYMKHLGVPFTVALHGVIKYNGRDWSSNPIHHTELTKDVRKYMRLKATEQKTLLMAIYPQDDMSNPTKRKKLFRQALKDNKIKRP